MHTAIEDAVKAAPLAPALVSEWERLHAAHNAAYDQYLRIHAQLSRRMREAGQGVRRSYPISDDIEAHLAASSALEKARLAMHEFCEKNAEYC